MALPLALQASLQADQQRPLPAPRVQSRSRWLPVHWAELPGLADDHFGTAWDAWVRGCGKPSPVWAQLCAQVRWHSLASDDERRAWLIEQLQPYQVQSLDGAADGLLTGYYEPLISGSRVPSPGFSVPLYRPPATLASKRPWYTRQEMDTLPQAQAALAGHEIVWLADPVDALVLQIQGSGRIQVSEADGRVHVVRLAFAGSNEQPYQSVGRWLLDRGETKDATWPGIKAWIAAHPGQVQQLLWQNPRVVFFREEPLDPQDLNAGPRGAQGVALTAGRSIAVDPGSIPYGTPVWLSSSGPQTTLQRLVLAQDTGSAITGAVRADLFVGQGEGAGELAGRLKQPLRLWALWPK